MVRQPQDWKFPMPLLIYKKFLILSQFGKKNFDEVDFGHIAYLVRPLLPVRIMVFFTASFTVLFCSKNVLASYKNALYHKVTTCFLFIFSRFPEMYSSRYKNNISQQQQISNKWKIKIWQLQFCFNYCVQVSVIEYWKVLSKWKEILKIKCAMRIECFLSISWRKLLLQYYW